VRLILDYFRISHWIFLRSRLCPNLPFYCKTCVSAASPRVCTHIPRTLPPNSPSSLGTPFQQSICPFPRIRTRIRTLGDEGCQGLFFGTCWDRGFVGAMAGHGNIRGSVESLVTLFLFHINCIICITSHTSIVYL